ncbi:hypothetical protein TNCV_3760991 [Trichonephila clavipes]|nr:hypothetical protein TNCV_3760991 [Trichonephila clavipes]
MHCKTAGKSLRPHVGVVWKFERDQLPWSPDKKDCERLRNEVGGVRMKNSTCLFEVRRNEPNMFPKCRRMNGLKQISQEVTVFYSIFLLRLKRADIENYVEFLSKEISGIKIDDNCLFEVERRLNVHLNSNKFEQLENQRADKLSLVYADKPQTLDHLEDNIRRVIADIRPQMLEKVIENWTSRLDYIRASRGSPMPEIIFKMTATAGSDVVQSGRPIFDDFFQHLWPYIGNNTANVVFQMVKRLWLIRIDQ